MVGLMKKLWLIALSIGLIGLAAPSPVLAGKGNKGNKQPGVFEQYDKNANGVLDTDEKEAILKAFKDGNADLKVYDTNSDGKLSDEEIAAIKPAEKKHKKKNK